MKSGFSRADVMEMTYTEMIAHIAGLQEMDNPNFKIDTFLNRDKYFAKYPEKAKEYFAKNRKKLERQQ